MFFIFLSFLRNLILLLLIPHFYSFSKSLQSYEKTVDKNTKLLISSDAEFYKYIDKK